ncbi:MAG: carbon-nitrogen hydrolase family protein [Pseudomonadota bacterium]
MTLVAAVQLCSTEDVARNLASAERWIREAARRGAALVGLPENFAFLGTRERDKLAMQEPLDGPIVQRFRDLARELGVDLILGGFQERSPDPERPYNTSVAIGVSGDLVATYRKIHLFDVDLGTAGTLTESRHTTAGEQAVVCELAGLKVGLSICYDLRFGALYTRLVDAGAQLLTIPAAFTLQTGKDHWEVLQRARAIEFQSYVLAPAQFGKHNERRHSFGSAMVVDPWGTVLARCAEAEGACLAEVDLGYLRQVRERLPALQHRRNIIGP